MRTLLKATFDTDLGNAAIKDGSLGKIIESLMEKIKPEAAYFTATEGCRSCIIVFDMKDSSDIPAIAEPLFMKLNAEVEFSPVMNVDDLKKGLGALKS
ncbi:MAG: hypothetical protein WAT71_10475 [Ignavibacteria bacterium]